MMNIKLFSLLVLLSLFLPNEGFATTYYVCDNASGADPNCIPGNDSNPGTSIDAPWQSIAKVMTVFNSLEAGDQILFAKGGAWTDASFSNIFNFNASAENPIIFDSYAPSWGGTAKPILTESRAGINLFNFADGGNADHDEGYTVRNLDLRGEGTGQWAIFAYNDADHITLDNLDISGFGIAIHCAGSNTPNPGADGQNQYMKVLNSTIINCYDQGFLGGGDYLQIENCYFENNGFSQSVLNHNIYVSSGNDVIIRNNELYQSAVVNGIADGVSLVVHGMHSNLLIEGNYIHEDPGYVNGNAWGIAVDPGGYGYPEGSTGLIIRGNFLENMFNTGIAITSCPGAIIENNIIINENASDFRAIVAPNRMRDDDDLLMTNLTVRNNSIYLRNASIYSEAIEVGGEGSNHVIVSNAISIDNGNGFDMDLSDSDYQNIDYNMIELLNNAQWGDNQALEDWTLARGFDQNSISGDPLFTSPDFPDYNFIPLPSSPLINAGHPTMSATTDFNGVLRDNMADIGAFEYTLVGLLAQSKSQGSLIACYPNPSSDQVVLKTDISLIGSHFNVYNAVGQSVLLGKINTDKVVIELGHLPDGIYQITITENRNYGLRVLKN